MNSNVETETKYDFDELKKLLLESNGALRSSYQIALREGRDTNWESYAKKLADLLERQHKVIYSNSWGDDLLKQVFPGSVR